MDSRVTRSESDPRAGWGRSRAPPGHDPDGDAAVVGLTFAVGVVIGRAAEPAPKADDPLAKLERAAAASAQPGAAAMTQAQAARRAQGRRGQAELPEHARGRRRSARGARRAQGCRSRGSRARQRSPKSQRRVPAAVAAARRHGTTTKATRKIATTSDDANAASARDRQGQRRGDGREHSGGGCRRQRRAPPAQRRQARPDGRRGDPRRRRQGREPHRAATTASSRLQVDQLRPPEPSRAFAEGLRAKGHAAFVVAADIPDRGRYYRVRIGPFKGREQAEGVPRQVRRRRAHEHLRRARKRQVAIQRSSSTPTAVMRTSRAVPSASLRGKRPPSDSMCATCSAETVRTSTVPSTLARLPAESRGTKNACCSETTRQPSASGPASRSQLEPAATALTDLPHHPLHGHVPRGVGVRVGQQLAEVMVGCAGAHLRAVRLHGRCHRYLRGWRRGAGPARYRRGPWAMQEARSQRRV